MAIISRQGDEQNRDERLARLLEQMTAEARAGRGPGLDALTREHPDLSGELRELWAAVMIADAVALHSTQNLHTAAPPSDNRVLRSRLAICRGGSATTSCWRNWAAAGWASSIKRGR